MRVRSTSSGCTQALISAPDSAPDSAEATMGGRLRCAGCCCCAS
jgi:hypothetical protein